VIVVYGLAPAGATIDRPLDDGVAPLRALPCGPLVAIVAEHPHPPPRTTGP
jgi:hypothetical protein